MTDNDIIKALELCIDDECRCGECPYFGIASDGVSCGKEHGIDMLNLINRQKAEIERLDIELQAMRTAANSYKMHYENAKSICRGEAVDIVDYLIEILKNSNGGAYSLLLMKLRKILTATWLVSDIEIDQMTEDET